MRIIHIILTVLFVFVLVAEGAASPKAGPTSRSEMKAMYDENLRLATKIKELEKQLAEMKFEIDMTEKAIENYKFVRTQNGKYIETMKP